MADHQKSENLVVWILGAGFSRPLSGPLLFDFFRPELQAKLRARYGRYMGWSAFEQNLNVLSQAYFGINVPDVEPPEKEPRGTPWRNAEEFIEYIELASRGNDKVAQSVIEASYQRARTKGPAAHMDSLARVAKKYLALCCWEFTENADPKTERWAPYRSWARQLDPAKDAVITFNYDVTCERAVGYLGDGAPSSAFAKPWCVAREQGEGTGCDRYLKLHGSSNWYVPAQPDSGVLCLPFSADETPPAAFLGASVPHEPAIAIPGPDKVGLADRLFKRHWSRAEELLRLANVVVFVGYRFPESDNEAKRRILAALSENDNKALSVHLVLGPQRGEDVVRLESLLNWALSNRVKLTQSELETWQRKSSAYAQTRAVVPRQPGDLSLELWHTNKLLSVSHQPLWAQDFLGVFDRERLNGFIPSAVIM